MEECSALKNAFTGKKAKDADAKKPADTSRGCEDEDEDNDKDPCHKYVAPIAQAQTVFSEKITTESKHEHKLLGRKCLNVSCDNERISDPRLSPWSHREISFSRQDRWAAIPESGRFPLVLDPCINTIRFERVLVDGGSSIDLLFHNSLPHLRLTKADLQPYQVQF